MRGEQIKQLRANAEEAFSQRSLQDALAYAEQALTLDKSNTELIGLRDKIAAHDIHFTGKTLDLGLHDERDDV